MVSRTNSQFGEQQNYIHQYKLQQETFVVKNIMNQIIKVSNINLNYSYLLIAKKEIVKFYNGDGLEEECNNGESKMSTRFLTKDPDGQSGNYSKTTTRHINKYLGDLKHTVVSQSTINDLLKEQIPTRY